MPTAEGSNVSYLQLFREGALESATAGLFVERPQHGKSFPSLSFANYLFELVNRTRRLMAALGISPPASLFVTLIGAKGFTLGISANLSFIQGIQAQQFDRDLLLLRDVVVTDWGVPVETLLKPLLDELWQAAGLPRCFDYDNDANWTPARNG